MSGPVETPNPFADEAHLGKPINLGISGIQHVLRSVKDGTSEVRDLIFNECELLYECRACRNLFRQLPNFLYHKREFCKKHYCENMMAFTAEDVPEEVIVVQPDSPKSNDNDIEMENVDENTEDIDQNEGEDVIVATSVPKIYNPSTKLTPNKKEDLGSRIGENSASLFYKNCENIVNRRANSVLKKSIISLQPIQSNPNAMYQSVKDVTQDVKSEESNGAVAVSTSLAEIRQKIEEARTAVITQEEIGISARRQRHDNSDGAGAVILRLKPRSDCNVDTLSCLTCKIRYHTLKTLDFHMRSVHSDTRMYYPCPFCTTSFVQIWSVMRHVTSIHKKTKEQSYKLKELIKSRGFRKNPPLNNSLKQNDQPSTSDVKQNIGVSNPTAQQNKTNKSNKNSNRGDIINAICKKQSILKSKVLDILKNKNSKEKAKKSPVLHICCKCDRAFSRPSARITHEKFCTGDVNKSNNKTKTAEKIELESEERKPTLEQKLQVLADRKVQSILERRTHSDKVKSNLPAKVSTKEETVPSAKESKEQLSEDLTEYPSRPKRNAKKKQEADFVPLYLPSCSRASVSRPSRNNENSLLQKLNMTSVALENKVLAIIDTKKLRCLKCNRRFSTFSNLRRHAAIHIGWNRYKCKYCDYQSYNRSDCRSHIRRNHLHGKHSLSHVDKFVVDLPPDSPPLFNLDDPLESKTSPESNALPPAILTLTKSDVNALESSFNSDSSETESSQPRSPVASVQSSASTPSTPKRAKKSKEQCLYEGDDTGTLKTRSGSYPKVNLFGKNLQNKVPDGIEHSSSPKKETSNCDQQPSTSNMNLVPPTCLKSTMTSKIQKFIYVHDDFLPQLKTKTTPKAQLGTSCDNT